MSSNNTSTNNSFYYPQSPAFPAQASNPYAEGGGRDYRGPQPGYYATSAQPPQYIGPFNAIAQQASAVNTLYMANPPSQMFPPPPQAGWNAFAVPQPLPGAIQSSNPYFA